MRQKSTFILVLLTGFSLLLPAQSEGLRATVDGLLTLSVPVVSVEELSEELQAGEKIILLDARGEKEYQVSHLQGAKFVGYTEFRKKRVADLPRDAKVVVYCTVGYRSEKIGERLEKLGFSDVRNLYGGICDWVNKDMPVVDPEGNPTEKVHTYDKSWGKWFEKGEKVE